MVCVHSVGAFGVCVLAIMEIESVEIANCSTGSLCDTLRALTRLLESSS